MSVCPSLSIAISQGLPIRLVELQTHIVQKTLRGIYMSNNTQITVKDNGPLLLKGPFVLQDSEGNDFTTDKEVVALCRCGASTTQPFCNGTHRKIEFESVVRAIDEHQQTA